MMVRWAALTGFLLGAVALLPLRFVLPEGFSAVGVGGTVWDGRLDRANWRGIGLGDLVLGLQPLGLLAGEVRLGLGGDLAGAVIAGSGVDGLSGRRAVTGLPVDSVLARDVTLRFEGGRCVAAGGSVTVTMPGGAAPMVAKPRCAGATAVLAFASADGLAQLHVAVGADGQMSVAL